MALFYGVKAARVHLNELWKVYIPCDLVFISDKILRLDTLYFKSVSMLMHDVYNNMTPLNISNLFISAREINKCNTRFSSGSNFYVKNSISDDLCNSSKNKFKRKLHEILFSILIN